jgi:hypothetical protein
MLMQFRSVYFAPSFGEVTPTSAEENCAAEYYAIAGGTVSTFVATDYHVSESEGPTRR